MLTQIFITNWILLLNLIFVDLYFLGNKLEHSQKFSLPLGAWVIATIASTPVWLLYMVWSFNGKV